MSLRAVSARSSNSGWAWSSFAARAPVNPAAPNTATLCGTYPASELLLERRANRSPLARDLLIGQRPIRRAVAEVQRERHVVGADPLGVPVDVEHLDRAHQRGAAHAHDLDHLGSRDLLGHHHREVLAHLGEARQILVADRSWFGDGIEVELEGGNRLVYIPRGCHERVDLPDPAGGMAVDDDRGAASGMEEWLAARRHLPAGLERFQQ